MEHFSEFPNYDTSTDTHGLFARLLEFFTSEYLVCLRRDELHILYDRNVVFELPSSPDTDDGGEPDEPEQDDDSEDEDDEDDEHKVVDGTETRLRHRILIRQGLSTTSRLEFDTTTAISQAAISWNFHSAWGFARTTKTSWSDILLQWGHLDLFYAEFKPITIRLLSNNAAIILLNMASGFLKAGSEGLSAE
jgi:hypothetical protein